MTEKRKKYDRPAKEAPSEEQLNHAGLTWHTYRDHAMIRRPVQAAEADRSPSEHPEEPA